MTRRKPISITGTQVFFVGPNPDPEAERKIADEKLCLWLLTGYSVDDGKIGFPKSGSTEEWAARAALARRIRDDMGGFTGDFLACAVDPRTPLAPPSVARPIRRIRFDKPRGKPPTVMRDLLVVDFIKRKLSELIKEDAALLEAEREFNLHKSRVHALWAAYKRRAGESRAKPQRAHRSTK